jgi:hypothetical protein
MTNSKVDIQCVLGVDGEASAIDYMSNGRFKKLSLKVEI